MTTLLAELARHDFPDVELVDVRYDDGHVTATLANGMVIEADDVTYPTFRGLVDTPRRQINTIARAQAARTGPKSERSSSR